MRLDGLLEGLTRVLNEGASTTSYKWLLLWSDHTIDGRRHWIPLRLIVAGKSGENA